MTIGVILIIRSGIGNCGLSGNFVKISIYVVTFNTAISA